MVDNPPELQASCRHALEEELTCNARLLHQYVVRIMAALQMLCA